MESIKKVSIIINTKDKLSRLRLVLKALECQVDCNTEVIIVFDGCSRETLDGFDAVELSFTPIKVISTKNIGSAAARNRGVMQATGKILIFLDDDRIPVPDFVSLHVAAHAQKCAVLGERMDMYISEEEIEQLYESGAILEDFHGTVIHNAYKAFDSNDTFFRRLMFRIPRNPLLWLMFYTGNVSVEKEDILKVGMFDENFFGWAVEDMELGYRIQREGIKITKNAALKNYHITHGYDPQKRKMEIRRNVQYFINKYRKNLFMKAILHILKIMIVLRVSRRSKMKASLNTG
ncbi:MAG: glycosyltransferase [Firmicutes bacterium]|nr:glycosyltransferase [Bacillota bacterium]